MNKNVIRLGVNMSMRKRIISLSIVAILSLSTLNVAAALESKPTTTIHGGYTTSATAQQPTTLAFYAPPQAKIFEPTPVSGYLTTANGTGITDARIVIQQLHDDGKWHLFSIVFTTGKDGRFSDTVVVYPKIFAAKGGYHFRATYDGDGQYAPSVSNEVIVAVS
jgi:hypothetical protein